MKLTFSTIWLLCSILAVYAGITARHSARPKCGACPTECPSVENCKCGTEVDECGCCTVCSQCDLDIICKEKCNLKDCPTLEGDYRCKCDVGKDECGCCDVCMNCPYELCNLESENRCRNNTICKPPADLPIEIAIKEHIQGQCIHDYEGF